MKKTLDRAVANEKFTKKNEVWLQQLSWAIIYTVINKQQSEMRRCTGDCSIEGFLVEYCTTCGWDDGYTGSGADPYNPIKNTTTTMQIKKIYLAGKISGLPLHEVTMRFGAKEKELRLQGHQVVNPLSISVGRQISWEAIMKECITAMMDCDEVHLLPCWKDSRGATLEHTIAQELNLTIVYLS